MPVPKRYFHVSQDLNLDPECWAMTDKYGDRALRTWLQVLIFLDRSENRWRLADGWLKNLSRLVRQQPASVSRQVGEWLKNGWLAIYEAAPDGSALVVSSPNWAKYNKRREHNGNSSVPVIIPSFPTPTPILSSPTPKIKKEVKIKTADTPSAVSALPRSAETYESYRAAYHGRYGVNPVRNQKVNSLLCKLVEHLGVEAPQVAAFYLTHNNPFYVAKRHPVNLLLADAEGLRTQWATNTKATTSEARNAEQKDDINEQVKRVEALLQGRNR